MKTEGVYYNEWDPFCAQWLRNLMKKRAIPEGDVDERSIQDVTPQEVKPYKECHFFAGIGTWAYACKKTNAACNVRSLWTASLPCQPFSEAGARNGFADERHLWPDFHWLVRWTRPELLFGEQVASRDGEAWLDVVQAYLESEGYASGAVVLPACGVGAPHRRQRIWWVAYAQQSGRKRYKSIQRLFSSEGATQSQCGDPFAFAGQAVVDNLQSLLQSNGTSIGLERRLLHGYGNTIVAPLAIEFVRAALQVVP